METFYILSQILVIISYLFLATTYLLKNRKQILVFNLFSIVFLGSSYLFLSAWSGFTMTIVALIRNIVFLFLNKKNNTNKITKTDTFVFIILLTIIAIFAILTYTEPLNMLSVFAATLFTFSVWQKKPKVYKYLGIPICILWISYNVYIKSLFGVILESVLLTSVLIGLYKEFKKSPK